MSAFRRLIAAAVLALAPVTIPAGAAPLVSPLQQSVAEAVHDDATLSTFYKNRDFAPIWIGERSAERREAFFAALAQAGDHGLPAERYDPAAIRAAIAAAETASARGALEVRMTRLLTAYARDLSSGILTPGEIVSDIALEVSPPDVSAILTAFADGNPRAVLEALRPHAVQYDRLLREKRRLEVSRAEGGWGPNISFRAIEPGSTGAAVVALRDRLIRMGYLERTAVATYDAALADAVRAFQSDHGLKIDGVAGPSTIETLNVPLETRLEQVVVGLERQRWMNKPLEPRHILVNLAEQRAYIYDDKKLTFDTDVIVGSEEPDRRTPEFSETMTHMVINPTWYVPRSIAVEEYLPELRRGGARHLDVYSRNGRVDPHRIDFSRYNADNFPFSLRQPPGPRNALGRVKFMFPNRWNIYLHDTPARNLFANQRRTFSHGCVRVARPLEMAYHLLAPQTDTPEAGFDAILRTGDERRVDLKRSIGVHLVYWSVWVEPGGQANYRPDPYGRDQAVMQALRAAGVALTAPRS
ncbi:murein L,D-transpeptidase [Jannaschia seosinensis]|uniref:Murein L,D-transpeptidase n=2 Tax=Jannaschia seosinensis TaxID=313367 RepID=A0A0M7B4U0_9RHOB|nr:murein L,D-transpeptidase [Jannaschia seosinensis]